MISKSYSPRALPSYPPNVTGGRKPLEYNPERVEKIVLTFRSEPKKELQFELPSRLSLPFHWWMLKRGILKI